MVEPRYPPVKFGKKKKASAGRKPKDDPEKEVQGNKQPDERAPKGCGLRGHLKVERQGPGGRNVKEVEKEQQVGPAGDGGGKCPSDSPYQGRTVENFPKQGKRGRRRIQRDRRGARCIGEFLGLFNFITRFLVCVGGIGSPTGGEGGAAGNVLSSEAQSPVTR